MRLVQLIRGGERRIALVREGRLCFAKSHFPSVYDLARHALQNNGGLCSAIEGALTNDSIPYPPVWRGESEWKLLPSFDHPGDAAHCLVSGTGLTHKASARNRAAMHTKTEAEMTDSFRMFQMGLEGGSPPAGAIGAQPEWFYKGDGSILRGHNAPLTVPAYGDDGGEEPEIVGVYLISDSGEPVRVGLTVGNEFSDHVMEKKNYLYLAPSKLRQCSIGPELSVGPVGFDTVEGTVAVFRNGSTLWSSQIWSGESNMAHSIANLEHHHFKYEAHRRPGDVHIHFYGADAFSFGAGVALQDGDQMEVSFPDFGQPLRNVLKTEAALDKPVSVRRLD